MTDKSSISVLLVEDSALMRILISDLLRPYEDIRLVGTARNGKEGLEKAMLLQPDVIVSDLIMPEFNGLYLVEKLQKVQATPVILLSSLNKSDTLVFEALNKGAFDFLEKPRDKSGFQAKEKTVLLVEMIRAALSFNALAKFHKKQQKNTHSHQFQEDLPYLAIVIGASTGGPGAIENLLKQLPENLAVPVIIAQHMPQAFIGSFAERLDALSPLKVKVALKGEEIQAGTVYLASGHGNTKVKRNPESGKFYFGHSDRVFKEFNNPSIDCLMLSAAKAFEGRLIGVVLTGMGKDGAEGLMSIKDSGGFTLAQDEDSSVVFGMPKQAFDTGATDRLVPIHQMGGYIISCF